MKTMLLRVPALVKPFFPQLRRTFVKSTSDPASVVVRTKAAQALRELMKYQPRVNPVVTKLIACAKSNDDAVAGSFVLALSHVIKSAGTNVDEKARVCIHVGPVTGPSLPPSDKGSTCGAQTGIREVVLLPLDTFKIKCQVNPDAFRSRGVIRIFIEEGTTLYRGWGWTIARNAPGSFAVRCLLPP